MQRFVYLEQGWPTIMKLRAAFFGVI